MNAPSALPPQPHRTNGLRCRKRKCLTVVNRVNLEAFRSRTSGSGRPATDPSTATDLIDRIRSASTRCDGQGDSDGVCGSEPRAAQGRPVEADADKHQRRPSWQEPATASTLAGQDVAGRQALRGLAGQKDVSRQRHRGARGRAFRPKRQPGDKEARRRRAASRVNPRNASSWPTTITASSTRLAASGRPISCRDVFAAPTQSASGPWAATTWPCSRRTNWSARRTTSDKAWVT